MFVTIKNKKIDYFSDKKETLLGIGLDEQDIIETNIDLQSIRDANMSKDAIIDNNGNLILQDRIFTEEELKKFDIQKLHDIKTRSKEMRLEYLTTENRLERQTAAGADTTLTQAMLDEIASKGDVIEQEMSAQMGYMMNKYNMTAQEVMGLLLQ